MNIIRGCMFEFGMIVLWLKIILIVISFQYLSPLILMASCMSVLETVTLLAWRAHSWESSKIPTRYDSAAS